MTRFVTSTGSLEYEVVLEYDVVPDPLFVDVLVELELDVVLLVVLLEAADLLSLFALASLLPDVELAALADDGNG